MQWGGNASGSSGARTHQGQMSRQCVAFYPCENAWQTNQKQQQQECIMSEQREEEEEEEEEEEGGEQLSELLQEQL